MKEPDHDLEALRGSIRRLTRDTYEHAAAVADAFAKQQREIVTENRSDPLIELIDVIIKDVQGAYIRCFEP